MKIGILTHPLVCNYGGILQALSFFHYLKENGNEVIVIDRRNNFTRQKRFIKKFSNLLNIFHIRKSNPYHSQQHRFIREQFNRTNEIYSHQQLLTTINKERLDYIFIGSDQIWNPEFVHKSSMDYWGAFLNETEIKTSFYGGSMWSKVWEYDEADTAYISQLVKKVIGISAREVSTKVALEQNLQLDNVEYVLDPTLLHTKDFYDQFAAPRITENPYVFVYWLGSEDSLPDVQKLFPGYKILKCNFGKPDENLSVEDWLSAIKHANVVFTNSFHGCALSIIYQKHFIPFNQYNGEWDSRMLTLLQKLGMNEKMKDIYSVENYIDVYANLSELRQSSMSYIDKCLSTELEDQSFE